MSRSSSHSKREIHNAGVDTAGVDMNGTGTNEIGMNEIGGDVVKGLLSVAGESWGDPVPQTMAASGPLVQAGPSADWRNAKRSRPASGGETIDNPQLPDPELPNNHLPNTVLPDPALPDPALSDPALPAIDWQHVLIENQPWLRRVLYSRLGEAEAVDECLQEIGLAAVRQASPIRDLSKVGPWLYQLAIRQALLYRRKMGRRRALLNRYAERNRPVESDQGAFDPMAWLMDREKLKTVRQALTELKVEDREILLLKYAENWSYLQISSHLKVTHSAVEARLHRARQRLRKEIERTEKDAESDFC